MAIDRLSASSIAPRVARLVPKKPSSLAALQQRRAGCACRCGVAFKPSWFPRALWPPTALAFPPRRNRTESSRSGAAGTAHAPRELLFTLLALCFDCRVGPPL